MRKILRSNQEVAHVWAQQTQYEGRTSDGHLYFTGSTIYSYGSHFPIASFVEVAGQRAIFYTSESYSISTSKHKSLVRSALGYGDYLRDTPIFTVVDVSGDHAGNIKAYGEQFTASLRKAATSRVSVEFHTQEAANLLAEMTRYSVYFGLPLANLPTMPENLDAVKAEMKAERVAAAVVSKAARVDEAARYAVRIAEWMEVHTDVKAKWDGTRDSAEKLRAEWNEVERVRLNTERIATRLAVVSTWMEEHADIKAKWDGSYEQGNELIYTWIDESRERLAAERLTAWLAGDPEVKPFQLPPGVTVLRVKGDEVETSHGAYFPVSHARRGLALVKCVIASGKDWTPTDNVDEREAHPCTRHHLRLGHYAIDRIKADGTVYAGCHTVPFASIEAIAAQLEAPKGVSDAGYL